MKDKSNYELICKQSIVKYSVGVSNIAIWFNRSDNCKRSVMVGN